MFTLFKPTEALVHQYLRQQQEVGYSYVEVGTSRRRPPPGYDVDRHRVYLGKGTEVFERAKAAIQQWKMFPPEMATLYRPPRPPADNIVVAVLFRAGCMWSLNTCRVIYTLDETGPDERGNIERFGFAYGTLHDHLQKGEERFVVEWRRHDEAVWYEVLAVSQPRHILARLGKPIVRLQQRRFRHLSGKSMQCATRHEADVVQTG